MGTWTLKVSTTEGRIGGAFNGASLLLTGDCLWADSLGTIPAADPRSQAVYTDDFATAVAADADRAVLGAPGQDTINATPMTGRVVLDLSAGMGTLGGVAVTPAAEHGLRHAFGGAAGDDLRGSAEANTLDGSWGGDLLIGFGGSDALRGGFGKDTLIGNEENDRLNGGVGRDFAVFGVSRADAAIERLADGTVRISSAEGVDHLSSVETLVFLDGLRAMGMARPTDFSGDGYGDLLFRNGDGALQIWRLHGDGLQEVTGFVPGGAAIGATDTLAATGDWPGGGRADLLWRGADGSLRFTVSIADAWTTVDLGVVEGWTVRARSDLDGDGRADILWQHETGFLAGWTRRKPCSSRWKAGFRPGWARGGNGSPPLMPRATAAPTRSSAPPRARSSSGPARGSPSPTRSSSARATPAGTSPVRATWTAMAAPTCCGGTRPRPGCACGCWTRPGGAPRRRWRDRARGGTSPPSPTTAAMTAPTSCGAPARASTACGRWTA